LWTIEDSGNPTWLYANELDGDTLGYYELGDLGGQAGRVIENVDWEDLAYHDGYIYVADIGDNENSRQNITIYRFLEPAAPNSGDERQGGISDQNIERIVLRYPQYAQGERARDAETFMVDPLNGSLYIVAKQEPGEQTDGQAGLYGRAAAGLNWTKLENPIGGEIPPPATVELLYLGNTSFPANTANDSPSSGDISADGMEVAIKSDNTIHHYVRHSSNEFLFDVVTLGEEPHEGRPMQVVVAREQHNRESIAFDTDGNSFYTVSEAAAGGNERPVFRYDRGLTTSGAIHGGGYRGCPGWLPSLGLGV
jgi:hypothetical protein